MADYLTHQSPLMRFFVTLSLLCVAANLKAQEKTVPLKVKKPVVIQSTPNSATAASSKKLLFLDFYNESNDPNVAWLTDSIGESIFELTKDKYNYTRIESRIWRDYAQAQRFKPEDFYDIDKLQAMGLALKADGIIFGKFRSTAENIEISGKILSVVDKDIIAEKSIAVPLSSQMFEDVQDVSETLGSRIKDLFYPSDRGALWRSAALPGWGQFYKQRRIWGYTYSSVIGTGAAFTLFSFVMLQVSKQQYRNYNPDHVVTPQGEFGIKDPVSAQAEFSRLEAKANQWYQITLVSAGVTLGLYFWHLFDAWFFEGSYADAPKSAALLFDRNQMLGSGSVHVSGDREPLSFRLNYSF